MNSIENKILTIDFNDASAPADLSKSLHNTGFAVVKNHPILSVLIDDVYQDWKGYFAGEDKHGDLFDLKKQDGYFPFRSENASGSDEKDLKEFYHIYTWGRYPSSISKKTKELYRELLGLGSTLLSWIDRETPDDVRSKFTIPLSDMITDCRSNLLRVINYPPLSGDENSGAIRAAAHCDINLITILVAGSQPGLQVMSKSGEWVDVNCDRKLVVVNNGDMLKECSGGYYPSTVHRVVNPSENSNLPRLSMPMFIHPRDEVVLSERYTGGSYLEERLREIGLK